MQGNYYTKAIAEVLGVAVSRETIAMLDQVEEFMRNDVFHSTLDWQTKRQFAKGAREAKAMYDYLQTPKGREEFAGLVGAP